MAEFEKDDALERVQRHNRKLAKEQGGTEPESTGVEKSYPEKTAAQDIPKNSPHHKTL